MHLNPTRQGVAAQRPLKDKLHFLHIKPYNKDIYDNIQELMLSGNYRSLTGKSVKLQHIQISLVKTSSEIPLTGSELNTRHTPLRLFCTKSHHCCCSANGSFSRFGKHANSCFRVISHCLTSFFSVGTREDTTKHSMSFKGVFIVFFN